MRSLEKTAASLGMDVLELLYNCLTVEHLDEVIRSLEKSQK